MAWTKEQKREDRARKKALKELASKQNETELSIEDRLNNIFDGLKHRNTSPPDWIITRGTGKTVSVPTILCSDWHFGEVVDPSAINGVNKYNLEIAKERAKLLIERTIDLCFNHTVNPSFPGIVMALAGDLISGDIHEELTNTNDVPTLPTLIELHDVLIWCIKELANAFGNVFVPCVSGNHARTTKKIQSKNRNYTNFDWLLCSLLAKRFEDDNRIRFLIPEGPDAYYSVYGTRYLLRHGDSFRGGDGIIGALGPVVRGDLKTRGRQMAIDQPYDTMLIGHFHQYLAMPKIIMNGSLIGYNEYAFNNNFGFEPPRQALWLTHPDHGITISMPVFIDTCGQGENNQKPRAWVSVFE